MFVIKVSVHVCAHMHEHRVTQMDFLTVCKAELDKHCEKDTFKEGKHLKQVKLPHEGVYYCEWQTASSL